MLTTQHVPYPSADKVKTFLKLVAKAKQNVHTLYLQESLVRHQTWSCNRLSSSTETKAILLTLQLR